ncbi:SDR family oxidoreductase [Croceicoccus ponticola]|uniref:SDR family oxidoreductase n=1 Tax=Croceicoccus ponticola TaxID=2217664 RepID=A0A437GWR8_9SPHN|nr:SDR family oxidoreductase [Croceicoccus ponticola]RVQ66550.1 SDR family oxidoreductase [Croceicoccus ponticola]
MANVVITGAGRGIGLELARTHAERGDRVFALVRDTAKSADLSALADGSGGKVTVHKLDAADIASIPAAAEAVPCDSVDVLYNVAGVAGPISGELENPVDWGAWDQAIDVMLKAPFAITKAFLPKMGEGSKVVNFSSQLAASTWPYGGFYVYVATKAGLVALTRSLAIDLKDRGITLISLHPGWVKTDMGGPEADITTEESVAGITALTDRLTIADTGGFFKWNGEPHPL